MSMIEDIKGYRSLCEVQEKYRKIFVGSDPNSTTSIVRTWDRSNPHESYR